MRTRLVLAVLPVALVGSVVAPSLAAPKPIKGSFTAAANPDPSSSDCQGLIPSARHLVPFKVPSAGKMTIKLTGFQGDWDLALESKTGSTLGASTGFVDATTETITLKFKKAQDVVIVACNYLGGPTAAGSFEFVPAK